MSSMKKRVEFDAAIKPPAEYSKFKTRRLIWTNALMWAFTLGSFAVQSSWLISRQADGSMVGLIGQMVAMMVTGCTFLASKSLFPFVTSFGQKVALVALIIFTGLCEAIGIGCHNVDMLHYQPLVEFVMWYLTFGQPFFAVTALVAFFLAVFALDVYDRALDAQKSAEVAESMRRSHERTAHALGYAKRLREAERRHTFMMLINRAWFFASFGRFAKYVAADGKSYPVSKWLVERAGQDLVDITEGEPLSTSYTDVTDLFELPTLETEPTPAPTEKTQVTLSDTHQQVTLLCNLHQITPEMLQTEMGYEMPLRDDVRCLVKGLHYTHMRPEVENDALQAVTRLLRADTKPDVIITTGDQQAVTDTDDVTLSVTSIPSIDVTPAHDLVTQHLQGYTNPSAVTETTKNRRMCNPECENCNGYKTVGACKTDRSRKKRQNNTLIQGEEEK